MGEQRFARKILKRADSWCPFTVSVQCVHALCPYIMQQFAFKVSLDF